MAKLSGNLSLGGHLFYVLNLTGNQVKVREQKPPGRGVDPSVLISGTVKQNYPRFTRDQEGKRGKEREKEGKTTTFKSLKGLRQFGFGPDNRNNRRRQRTMGNLTLHPSHPILHSDLREPASRGSPATAAHFSSGMFWRPVCPHV